MAWTKFGPGTVTYTIAAGTPLEFAQEIKGGGINHAYEEVGESITYLDGSGDPASEVRGDSVTFECDFDLGTAGFYNFLFVNDLTNATITYTPNTAAGATWGGTVRLRLPEAATADAFGAKISGSVSHSFVGPLRSLPLSQPRKGHVMSEPYVTPRRVYGLPDWLAVLLTLYLIVGATGGLWFAIDRIQSW